MAGWLTDGVPQVVIASGAELSSVDTQQSNGSNPQTGSFSLQQLAQLVAYYNTPLDKTMVAGSRYISTVNIGFPATLTGVSVRVGGTGGTDKWIVELHGPTGLLLATSDTSGTTAGTASTWQQIAFTATYSLTIPGTYSIALQSNGTTAKFASLNVPATSGVFTGSATGSFGTGASVTTPTSYTANLGPQAVLY